MPANDRGGLKAAFTNFNKPDADKGSRAEASWPCTRQRSAACGSPATHKWLPGSYQYSADIHTNTQTAPPTRSCTSAVVPLPGISSYQPETQSSFQPTRTTRNHCRRYQRRSHGVTGSADGLGRVGNLIRDYAHPRKMPPLLTPENGVFVRRRPTLYAGVMLSPAIQVVFSPQAVLALPHVVTDTWSPTARGRWSKATATTKAAPRFCAASTPASCSGRSRPGLTSPLPLCCRRQTPAPARELERAAEDAEQQ
jgi:hypothetical protein